MGSGRRCSLYNPFLLTRGGMLTKNSPVVVREPEMCVCIFFTSFFFRVLVFHLTYGEFTMGVCAINGHLIFTGMYICFRGELKSDEKIDAVIRGF